MSSSEVARFREQQQLEEEAARLGLNGPATVASHAIISARVQRGAGEIVGLFEQGREEEALRLYESLHTL